MKYTQPYGISDPNAGYINGDPEINREGSIPPAEVFEHPQREIVAVIAKSEIVPSDGDLLQLTKAVRSQFLNYAEDTGSLNHLSVAYDPPIGAYTKGLVLHVKVKTTNTGGCDIQAGAGVVPVRKMNGADVGANDLPGGGLVQLMFDGTVFQLTNFLGLGGGTGVNDVFMVKIPYVVDTSTTPGVITAPFSPAITAMAAGDMIAVKVNNTSPGATVMNINSLPPISLAPNGGGGMLQGDVHKNDVVIFFYDGTYLYFAPNPEIDAAVTYTVGTGQNFPDPPSALNGIRRKTIGANGFVTFQMAGQVFQPFTMAHPSADRIMFKGTVVGTPPVKSDFSRTGNIADWTYNLTMLRSKLKTEIQLNPASTPSNPSFGLHNIGPGRPQFVDILITGNQHPAPSYIWDQAGVVSDAGLAIALTGVCVWGAQIGFLDNGAMTCERCFATACMSSGFVSAAAATLWADNCGAYANLLDGMFLGVMDGAYNETLYNGRFGVSCGGGKGNIWWHTSMGNGSIDIYAVNNAYIQMVNALAVGSVSPPFNVIGNSGALVTLTSA